MWGNLRKKLSRPLKRNLRLYVFSHFNPDKEVVLACDASLYGIGAVLSHRTEEGEKPIAYTSHSLSAAEKKYAQLDKERSVNRFRCQEIP